MIELRQIAEGILIPVQAQPRARRNAVTGMNAGRLKVAVTEAAEKGKANDAVIDVLAEALGLKKSQIRLARGATSTKKEFLVTDSTLEDVRFAVATCLSALNK